MNELKGWNAAGINDCPICAKQGLKTCSGGAHRNAMIEDKVIIPGNTPLPNSERVEESWADEVMRLLDLYVRGFRPEDVARDLVEKYRVLSENADRDIFDSNPAHTDEQLQVISGAGEDVKFKRIECIKHGVKFGYCEECAFSSSPTESVSPYGILVDPSHCEECAQQIEIAENTLNKEMGTPNKPPPLQGEEYVKPTDDEITEAIELLQDDFRASELAKLLASRRLYFAALKENARLKLANHAAYSEWMSSSNHDPVSANLLACAAVAHLESELARLKDRDERATELEEAQEGWLANAMEYARRAEKDKVTIAHRDQRIAQLLVENERLTKEYSHLLKLRSDSVATLAIRDAELRRLMWLSHGHLGIYGDDGEMQCIECGADYKRDSLGKVRDAYKLACRKRGERVLEKLKLTENEGEQCGDK